MAESGPTHRVLAVALDALEASWLDALCQRGDLPNLAAFAREALRTSVASDGDTLHGSIWPTFASGAGPGVHGRYWWLQWLAEEMGYVRSSHPAFAYTPFWHALADAGRRVAIIDIPYAPVLPHPNLRHAVGWGVHDEVEPDASPPGYLDEIRRTFGRHPLTFDTVEPHSPRDLLAMAQGLARGMTLRASLVESLAADRTLDLAIVLCSETHKAGHYLARPGEIAPGVSNLDLIAQVLRPLDAAWPRILAAAGPETTIILFALHGMHHQVDYSPIAAQLIALALGRDPASAVPRPDLLRRIRDAIPDPVHRAIWQRLPARIRAARQAAINLRGANPAGEPLFSIGHDGDGAIRISLRGREAEGVIEPAGAPALLGRLAEIAATFRTPEGLPAYSGTLRIPDRFPGPRADRLPDLLLLSNRDVVAVPHLLDDAGIRLVNPSREARNGIHTGAGFCFVRPAAGFSPSARPADARDFAPTFHELLGVPPPAGLEGRSFLT